MWTYAPRRSRAASFMAGESGRDSSIIGVDSQSRDERLRRHLDLAHHLHATLSLLLALQQLFLSGYIAPVALGGDVLATRLHRLSGDNPGSDGRLDGHIEHLARDQLPQPLHHRAAVVIGLV